RVGRELRSGRQLHRLRARLLRGKPLGEGRGGRADEPASGEHVERARPLAHEVRRRLEPGLPTHAAAREQCDLIVAAEPGGGLGGAGGKAGRRALSTSSRKRALSTGRSMTESGTGGSAAAHGSAGRASDRAENGTKEEHARV